MTAATPGEAGREAHRGCYMHPDCGFHWHNVKDGLDLPLTTDGFPEPVCPRCEVARLRAALADRGAALDQARRDGAAEALREAADEIEYRIELRPSLHMVVAFLRTRAADLDDIEAVPTKPKQTARWQALNEAADDLDRHPRPGIAEPPYLPRGHADATARWLRARAAALAEQGDG